MINLQDYSGLPLLFNSHDFSLNPAGDISIDSINRVKLESIRPILLNKTLRYPILIYTEYSDIFQTKHIDLFKKSKLHYNIIVIPPGLLGIEYTKTHIFSPDKDQNDITAVIDIISGSGTILMQQIKEKGEFDFDTEVNFVSLLKVKRGDRVAIPQKYMYTLINAGARAFIASRLFEDDGKIDYRTIWREQGMSYYVIRKNARREIVRNPRYKEVPRIEKLKAEDNVSKYRLTSAQPVYTQFVHNPDRFKNLLV